jgi:hypothetical protein
MVLNSKNFCISIIALLISCGNGNEKTQNTSLDTNRVMKGSIQEPLKLTIEQANELVELPLACIHTEYPNKLGQILTSKKELQEPHKLHPVFYGCIDWHSSVHGYCMMVKLLKKFPDLDKAEKIRKALKSNIIKKDILVEVLYFKDENNKSFERTFGWAWLLKLAEELHTWDDPMARDLEQNLQPLTDVIVQMYMDFLPKLNYPTRIGEHANTAFGLSFAFDYATTLKNEKLRLLVESKAREFYMNDINCPFDWEPGGYDFFSPCFEEIDLMRRILKKDEFKKWINTFAPDLKKTNFKLEPGKVSDRKDVKLVHLDGLNFSRARVMYALAKDFPEYQHLIKIANEHVSITLPNLINDSYEGGHWLGTFAIYALDN